MGCTGAAAGCAASAAAPAPPQRTPCRPPSAPHLPAHPWSPLPAPPATDVRCTGPQQPPRLPGLLRRQHLVARVCRGGRRQRRLRRQARPRRRLRRCAGLSARAVRRGTLPPARRDTSPPPQFCAVLCWSQYCPSLLLLALPSPACILSPLPPAPPPVATCTGLRLLRPACKDPSEALLWSSRALHP